jgi:thiamine biosynthesis lipoprotein
MTLDPGGLGKGLAADLISTELVDGGAAGALVEIGGDLAVRGTAPGPGGWSIAVADPYGDTSALRVELLTGGVATSSSRIRTWLAGGRRLHHLLDPSTLQPTEGDVVACTVIAGTAAWGEASTKVAFVDGLDAGLEYYTRSGLAARVSTVDGRHHRSPAWKEFVR